MLFDIPCKPQVYFFLRYLYGEGVKAKDYGDMIQSNIFINIFARNKLKRFSYLERNRELGKSTYKCTYSIEVDNRDALSFGIREVSNAAVVRINEFVEHLFSQFFHEEMMLMKYHLRWKQNKCIEQFMLKLEIDEELLPFDTLKKNYFRYRNNKETFFQKSSITFVPNTQPCKKQEKVTVYYSQNDFNKLKQITKQYKLSFSETVGLLSLSKLPDVQLPDK